MVSCSLFVIIMLILVCDEEVRCFCFFKQKTAYEMRISDWSSDVCSSDLEIGRQAVKLGHRMARLPPAMGMFGIGWPQHSHPCRREQPGQQLDRRLGPRQCDKAGFCRTAVTPPRRPQQRLFGGGFGQALPEIGRASSRDRVGRDGAISVVAVCLKKKN